MKGPNRQETMLNLLICETSTHQNVTRLKCALDGGSNRFLIEFIGCTNIAQRMKIKMQVPISYFFKNGPFPASFSLFSSFQYTVDSKQMFNV